MYNSEYWWRYSIYVKVEKTKNDSCLSKLANPSETKGVWYEETKVDRGFVLLSIWETSEEGDKKEEIAEEWEWWRWENY